MIAFFLSMIVLTGLDQFTKFLVVKYLMPVGSKAILPKLLTFSYVENRGAAFSMLENARWLFVVITVVAMVIIIGYYLKKRPKSKLLCSSLVLIGAGALGNFIDRLALGYVVDFIKISFFNFTCNVADIYLTFGVILLIIYIFFFDKSEDKKHGSKKLFS